MFSYIWPIALVVIANVIYQICAKSVPEEMNPLASLTVTYLVGAAASWILFHLTNRNASLLREYGKLNWAPFVFGLVLVGLEVGFIYAYKAGWLAIALIFVGHLLYHEALTRNKLVGVAICLIGLIFINYK